MNNQEPNRTPNRPCADHFIGTEKLACVTCGWNDIMKAYNDELQNNDNEFEDGEPHTDSVFLCSFDHGGCRIDGCDCWCHQSIDSEDSLIRQAWHVNSIAIAENARAILSGWFRNSKWSSMTVRELHDVCDPNVAFDNAATDVLGTDIPNGQAGWDILNAAMAAYDAKYAS